jgi:hypothetical protein
MASLFRLGQLLKGKAATYTITKQLHESIWLATYVEIYFRALESRADLQETAANKANKL